MSIPGSDTVDAVIVDEAARCAARRAQFRERAFVPSMFVCVVVFAAVQPKIHIPEWVYGIVGHTMLILAAVYVLVLVTLLLAALCSSWASPTKTS